MNWTDERVELLRKLWGENLSVRKIAEQLGGFSHCKDHGRSAVIGKAHRLKLPGHKGAKLLRANVKKEKTPATPKPKATKAERKVTWAVPMSAGVIHAMFDATPTTPRSLIIRPTENVVVPISQHLQLDELNNHTCKWPNGDPLSEDFSFCGNEAVEGKLGTSNTDIPYCKYHCRIAFQAPYERRRTR